MSDTHPAGHIRSQSIVSSIFSEAWKRGTQLEESSKVTPVLIYIEKSVVSHLVCCSFIPLLEIFLALFQHSFFDFSEINMCELALTI